MTDSTLTNVVQESSNYDQFKFMDANRDQNRGHVELLKQAFEDMGNLTKVQPILVNDKMEIVDGQHRFIACKELGEPIYYTVVPGLTVRDARQMNILHRSWTLDDYVASYVAEGDENYILYNKLREDYGFQHTTMVTFIEGGERGKIFADFRKGKLKIENEAAARKRLDRLAEVVEFYPAGNQGKFARAFLLIMRSDNYDHRRMVNKVRQYADSRLKKLLDIGENMKQLEDLYNYNQTESTHQRLY